MRPPDWPESPFVERPVPEHRRQLLLTCGIVGFLGSIALVVGNIYGSLVVPGHDWVADTVSDLAAGPYEWIQDFALYGYAASLMAMALAASHAHPGTRRWNSGVISLALTAALVVIIGARNEYGDGDNEGVVIHQYLVMGMAVLFLVAMVAMARGLAMQARIYGWISLGCAALWAIGAPPFFVFPDGYDGIYERGLGVITLVWISMLSTLWIRLGRPELG